ncbi:hypothetical protein [Hyphomonas sp. BRH_c22]|uniref:hypothetical protein n=1 Tax=Hyphomonas sp. BRH_c22 TaxID=1629710 RepID=UPI000AAF5634|nr:hypothetical protein [Hyphomonas sp. BRH_c22]
MKRVLLAIGILFVLAVGLGPWAYRTLFAPGEPLALPAFDYRTTDSWAALPAEVPAPVWKDGWAVDVILIAPDAGLAPRSEAELASQTTRAGAQAKRMAESLAAVGPVYAPLFRRDSEQTDLSTAFQQYVDTHNRGRAFVIATDHTLTAEAFAGLKADDTLRERFGGFLRLTRDIGSDDPFPAIDGAASLKDYCPDQYSELSDCQPIVRIGRQDGMMIVAQDSPVGGDNLSGLTSWLEANVAKTAEPLGSLEEVEIIDIRRPGDTDENRATDKD